MAGLPEGFTADAVPPTRAGATPGSSALPPGFTPEAVQPDVKQPEGGVDVMTQTLYDMAKTPTERKRALEHGYGVGNVKEDKHGLYIDKEGKRLSPSASNIATKTGGFLLSEAAPTLGAVGFGALSSPGFATAVGGAMLGGAAGQAFNDSMLALAGVYDRSIGTQAKELASSGLWSGAGEGAGRTVARGAAAAMHERGALRGLARWAIGVDHAEITRAMELANAGVSVPMEAYSPNSPMIGLVRTWAKKYGHDPVAASAKPYYEKRAGGVLRDLGIPEGDVGTLTEKTSAVSYEKTGDALITKAKQKLAEEDAKFDRAVAAMRSGMDERMAGATASHQAKIDELTKAEEEARASATKLIDHGWQQIDETQDKMWKAAKLGEEPGNLAREYAKRVWDLRKAISRRARLMYDGADAMAGNAVMSVSGLRDTARAFLEQMPEDLQKTYPAIVRTLSKEEGDLWSFGEARNLRTELRDMANYEDLTSNFKNGIYKKLAGEVNAAIHAPGNQPKIKQAADLLDKADKFYSDNLARFKDQKVRALANQVRAGMPPNPEEVAKVALKGGNAERAAELKRIVGPEVWNASVAADIKGMMKDSQSLIPGQVEFSDFWRLVQDRMRSGVFDSYPEDIKRMILDQGRRVGTDIGKYKVPQLPGDDFKAFLTRADEIREKIKALSDINPVEALETELKTMQDEWKATGKAMEQQRASDQLRFLSDPTLGASEAAKRIIRDPDKLKAALLRFDADGPEIAMLRQSAAREILTMSLDEGSGKQLFDRLTKDGMTEEVQKRLFPNGLDQDVLKLAKDMKFLFDDYGDLASSFSATGQVTNPRAGLPKVVQSALRAVPLFVVRSLREKQIGNLVNWMTSPDTVRWLARGLNGNPAEREAVKRAVQSTVDTGGNVGAAMGSVASQAATSPNDPRDTRAAAGPPWREYYQKKYGR